MTVEVTWWPEAEADFADLPTNELKLMAIKHLIGVERRHDYGELLTDHPIWGDLSDCRKIFLDESHDRSPRWRIVYKVLPDETNPERAEVMIIGPRRDDSVYVEVMRRLDRPLGPLHPTSG